ncbi:MULTISPECIES: ATPase, T2SS/T4P/T4SS family [Thalassospira]|uniref:Type II/IV secretion system protein n=1 Tax=Thalassospira profundimaris TaxID=502049 RepID=A0A367X262_9PROT|nr:MULTISPECIES: ATPase, T2SS/T4P/T4SS family [Thalassospira]KZC98688.1 type II/IV secretion system protein [Thalassospira sp. MCCC 1A02898]MEE3046413.1 ATPase, T2SS/T4P/T4SS family [Pseudomonadota bacterium]RCK47747.1 type II/IV secretion system protein [Thalassospira profundimaris]HAI31609.1 type II/IV secretion system protein [Thalassospira sp.]|tara:strand:+ start:22702 stop:23721 length:1020 start_codon:yes stop_codon:yes gene_type:complete
MNAITPPINPVYRQIVLPLAQYYDDPNTVEVRLNKPGQIIVDRRGEGKQLIVDENLTQAAIEQLCKSLSNVRGLNFDPDNNPILSTALDEGHRFECLVGPSVRSGLSLAIRCKHPFVPTWDQLIKATRKGNRDALDEALERRKIRCETEIRDVLIEAMVNGWNIIISGGTNTGKTTLLNLLLASLDDDIRVIGAEDTMELALERFWDGNGLLAARESAAGTGMVDWRVLFDHTNRITPDRVLFGEISTRNAFAALGTLNAGVEGVTFTIHSENPRHAIHRKFDQNIAWAGMKMDRVPEFLTELVDVVVQIKRDRDGFRRITDIWQPKNDNFILKDGRAA